jgi:transposase-like protein
MKCPKCHINNNPKAGIVKSKQRYKCKSCNYYYTVTQKSTAKSPETKKYALQLYLEGLGFRSIGRILGVSNVAVLKWIRSFGRQVEELRSEKETEVLEMDEMHTYIGNKKTIAGYGLLLIEMGKDSSISYLATEVRQREVSYGKQ